MINTYKIMGKTTNAQSVTRWCTKLCLNTQTHAFATNVGIKSGLRRATTIAAIAMKIIILIV